MIVKRPHNFNFAPGDWVFVKIPAIAKFEWHPFTISSAPEQADVISLHVRVVGHWTNKLYEYFEAEQKRLQCKLKGGNCAEPESKYESFQRTMMAARERARKTSRSILGPSEIRKVSSINSAENNNQGYVNYGIAEADLDPSMSETEKSLRMRMRKRDAVMRYAIYQKERDCIFPKLLDFRKKCH